MEIIIETDRLILRELRLEDASDLSLVLSDEESMIHYPHAFSAEEVSLWIKRNIERYRTDGFGLWAVIRKSDGQFIGDCGITMQNIGGEILPEIGFTQLNIIAKMDMLRKQPEPVRVMRSINFI